MKRVYREHFIALLAFSLLAVLMTLPVILHMNTSIAGIGGDPWQTMWRFAAKSESGLAGFAQDVLGTGEPRLSNLSVWPWMPIYLIFGQPLAYNVIWLLHFILAGYAMALLIQLLTNRKSILEPAPLLAGIAYMLIPFHTAQSLGHFGAMQLEWIPFICIAAISFVRSPKIRTAIALGLLLTIQAWVEHHYIVWIGLFGIIAALVYRKEIKHTFSFKWIPLVILFLILIIGIVLPFIPTIRLASHEDSALELGIDQTIRFSADLFSFITPPPYHPIWGNAFHFLFGQYFTGNASESVQYLGISIVLAILFFHKHIPVKQKRLWVYTILFFGVMSLGPLLHMFGKETSLTLPYALIANLPLFSAIRVISRSGVMVSFATIVLFGWVIATNAHRMRTSFIVGAILLLEFLPFPFPMQSATLSPVYNALNDIPGKAVIEIPAATNYVTASRALYASALHKKEVLGNIALERGEDEEAYTLIKSIPAIRQLLYLRTTELTEARKEFFDQDIAEVLPDAMKYLNAYAIIVHTDSLSSLQNTALNDFLGKNTAFTKQSFGDALLYSFDPAKSPSTDGVFLVRGEGWENIGYDPKRTSVFAEIPHEATVRIINTKQYPVTVTLDYTLAPESEGELQAEKTIMVQPGEHEVVFKHLGAGKTIVQNPKMQVLTPL